MHILHVYMHVYILHVHLLDVVHAIDWVIDFLPSIRHLCMEGRVGGGGEMCMEGRVGGGEMS